MRNGVNEDGGEKGKERSEDNPGGSEKKGTSGKM